jgi:hypothetical protein
LPLDAMLDVIYHLAVDDLIPRATVQVAEDKVKVFRRANVRAEFDEQLDDAGSGGAMGDPETWGTLPEHQAATRAAMGFAGPPAGGPL